MGGRHVNVGEFKALNFDQVRMCVSVRSEHTGLKHGHVISESTQWVLRGMWWVLGCVAAGPAILLHASVETCFSV